MMKNRGQKRRPIDIPGLIGCALVILWTYAIFWYYGAAVRGDELLLSHLF